MKNNRRIFFSSDLMFRFGDAHGEIIESNWQVEVDASVAGNSNNVQYEVFKFIYHKSIKMFWRPEGLNNFRQIYRNIRRLNYDK
jgi:hypothetical protein